jgi:superfamily II DNA or RNA helicase
MICDEVQHWAAETCQIISDSSKMCQYRYGMSATPWRDKGDDILIDACFGKGIADISASFLIKKGFLIKPTIYFSKINNMRGMRKTSYANVYKQAIVENEARNAQIVTIARRFYESGRKVLVLVKQIAHGKLLEKLISDSIFMHGSTGKKKRQKHLDIMRKGLPQITIASVIFDEGIDCKPLDTLLLAGGGKSPTRALQRIGRILRPYPGKKDAIAVDFLDNCKYMQAHSAKRASIYETEEEFDIKVFEIAT